MSRRILLAALVVALSPSLASASGAKKKEGEAAAASFLTLPAMNTNVARLNGGRTVLTVEVGLDIPDPALSAMAALYAPRLKGAYLEVLQTYAAGLPPGGLPNADLLGQRLQQSTDKVLGKPGARLLLGSLVVN